MFYRVNVRVEIDYVGDRDLEALSDFVGKGGLNTGYDPEQQHFVVNQRTYTAEITMSGLLKLSDRFSIKVQDRNITIKEYGS